MPNPQTPHPADSSMDLPIGTALPDWQARAFPPHTAMTGAYTLLQPLDTQRHALELYNAFAKATSTRSWTYLPYGPFADFARFQTWLYTMQSQTDPQCYSVCEKSTGIAIGLCSFLRIDPSNGVIEVGHLHFSPLLQKTRIASEAMFLMMQRVFDELGYRRYEWKCDHLNQPSMQAAKRLGFTFEGIFRQAVVYKQRSRDTAWFSILDSEWPALKQSFQTWLAADNFDEHGHQIKGLQDCRPHQK